MTDPVRVVSVGLGPIGLAAVRLLREKSSVELIGAVDIDPDKLGKDLGELLGTEEPVGMVVDGELDAALERLRPDAVVLCTSSSLTEIEPQLLACLQRGIDVVSSCEELLVPDHQHPELAARLDEAGRQGSASVLGTGVNPGFAMDFLAVVASAVASEIHSVRCVRVVDAATRRESLQRKVGAGLTKSEFHKRLEAGGFGHAGMRESVALVARGLGFEVDRIEHEVEPVLAPEDHKTPYLVVKEGAVAGLRDRGRGFVGKRAVIELDLSMYVGAPDPHDQVEFEGTRPLRLRFPDGIAGDEATAAMLVNCLHPLIAAEPGVRTMLDIPLPRFAR